ncbi:hypothetical protein RYX56_11680 [Alkalihalophilus lindianensis]|uniref:YqfQ-like protein n=1 Tax=Alkalihalophilus lindianensis TaxID=1630542 RepID=A0ABU3XAW0_9BACI|nr:hypothetical protein [Alkalihalophilus lindianensis]MDV2685031.1 hypothetical protein [Alkalihalophilus lindianensis]
MSDKNREEPQTDLFSQLMFGAPPKPAPKKEEIKAPPTQLEQILTLVQTVAPTLEKLAPFMGVITTFFTQQQKQTDTSAPPSKNIENDEQKESDNA